MQVDASAYKSFSARWRGCGGVHNSCYLNVIARMKLICCECSALKPFSISLEECLFKMIFFFFTSTCKYPFVVPGAVMGSSNICLHIPRQLYLAATTELNNCLNLSKRGLKTHSIQNSQILSSFKYFLVLANAARLRKAVSPMWESL